MSMIIVCSSASSPYATANGSDTISRLSTIPFIELRRYCLFVRSAAAGTPTTARTFEASIFPFFPLTPTRRSRCLRSSRTASTSFSEPSFRRPRSSGRCRSSIVRFSTASCPMRTSRFRTFRATMSRGQPTKLSTTKRSPLDAEMALLEVPRSMPTLRISAILFISFLPTRRVRACIGADALEERPGDLLPVFGRPQHGRFLFVRDAADFREDGRHVRRHQYEERSALHAPVFQPRVFGTKRRVQLLLDDVGELLRFVPPRVGIDAFQQLAHVGHRVPRHPV